MLGEVNQRRLTPAALSLDVPFRILMTSRFHPTEIARRLFSIDVRSLAALRTCLGLLILVDLWLRSEFLTEHYTDAGVLPRQAVDLANFGFVPSLYMLDGST